MFSLFCGSNSTTMSGNTTENRLSCTDFLRKNYAELVARVQSVMALADVLKSNNMLHDENYSEIKAETTNQNKMRKLFEALDSGGDEVKTAFYDALRESEPFLFKDLGGTAEH